MLLQHPGLWRAAGAQHSTVATIPTGFAALDEKLHGHGWPAQGVVEVLVERPGSGELSVFLPALASLCAIPQAGGWLAWINPPYEPYAPALALQGLDVNRLLIVRAAESLWAMEQALRSACCRVVLGWVEEAKGKALRRLQLATERSGSLCLLFRPVRYCKQASPASLRFILHSLADHAELQLIKIRGERPALVRLNLEDRSVYASCRPHA
jgi:hypothetical protein